MTVIQIYLDLHTSFDTLLLTQVFRFLSCQCRVREGTNASTDTQATLVRFHLFGQLTSYVYLLKHSFRFLLVVIYPLHFSCAHLIPPNIVNEMENGSTGLLNCSPGLLPCLVSNPCRVFRLCRSHIGTTVHTPGQFDHAVVATDLSGLVPLCAPSVCVSLQFNCIKVWKRTTYTECGWRTSHRT